MEKFKKEFPELVGTSGDIIKPIPSSALPRAKGETAPVPSDADFIRAQLAQERSAKGVLGAIPLVGTALFFKELSNVQRAAFLALDAVDLLTPFIPIKGIVSSVPKAVRQAEKAVKTSVRSRKATDPKQTEETGKQEGALS